MAVVYRCVGILMVDVVVFFRNHGIFHSQDSFPTTFRPWLWETSSGVVAVGMFSAEARTAGRNPENEIPRLWETSSGVVAVGMFSAEAHTAGRNPENRRCRDDIDHQDSNSPIDHGHLARNCSIKIKTGRNKLLVNHLDGVAAPVLPGGMLLSIWVLKWTLEKIINGGTALPVAPTIATLVQCLLLKCCLQHGSWQCQPLIAQLLAGKSKAVPPAARWPTIE